MGTRRWCLQCLAVSTAVLTSDGFAQRRVRVIHRHVCFPILILIMTILCATCGMSGALSASVFLCACLLMEAYHCGLINACARRACVACLGSALCFMGTLNRSSADRTCTHKSNGGHHTRTPQEENKHTPNRGQFICIRIRDVFCPQHQRCWHQRCWAQNRSLIQVLAYFDLLCRQAPLPYIIKWCRQAPLPGTA